MSAHSILGASSAGRWMKCPGSVRLCKGLPNVSSEAAKEGTAAHWFAEQCLKRKCDADYFLGTVREGYTCTPEMAAHVQVYLDAVRAVMK